MQISCEEFNEMEKKVSKRHGKESKYFQPQEFYYITHIKNLPNIISQGIFCHNEAEKKGLLSNEISSPEVMERRKNQSINGLPLWNYANLYIRATNAMLYRIILKYNVENLVILCIKKSVLNIPNSYVTNKNAACSFKDIYPTKKFEEVFKKIGKSISWQYWTEEYMQEVMAEILIPNRIPPEYIQKILVPSVESHKKILKFGIDHKKFPIIVEESQFFLPTRKIPLTRKMWVVRGDMFYSEMKTLTISVNTVGVMGAGLASRVKLQFFDVFEEYLQALKKEKLKMGEPYLYKRPDNIGNILVVTEKGDEEFVPSHWYLLFPTKNHWVHNSDIKGIEKGLIYLKENYKTLGINSLALPALGCGLGKLSWDEIGPMIVKHLKDTEMEVEIYLPDKEIPEKQLTKEFLLGN